MDIKSTIDNFNKKGFRASFFEDKNEAKNFIFNLCKESSVGIGGSMTMVELGWYEDLQKRGDTYWHMFGDRSAISKARNAEIYISSANALSEDGAVINIDGFGNRVSNTMFGAKKVIFVCGINKLAKNIEEAVFRAKNIAAPKNAMRLGKKTPCAVKADKCYNCSSPERICCVTSIMDFPVYSSEIYIVIINENLGY